MPLHVTNSNESSLIKTRAQCAHQLISNMDKTMSFEGQEKIHVSCAMAETKPIYCILLTAAAIALLAIHSRYTDGGNISPCIFSYMFENIFGNIFENLFGNIFTAYHPLLPDTYK